MCCSVLQCTIELTSHVLQCVAMYTIKLTGHVLQRVAFTIELTSHVLQCVAMYYKADLLATKYAMGWLWIVGSLKIHLSFAEYSLFYRALLHTRPMFLTCSRLNIPYEMTRSSDFCRI